MIGDRREESVNDEKSDETNVVDVHFRDSIDDQEDHKRIVDVYQRDEAELVKDARFSTLDPLKSFFGLQILTTSQLDCRSFSHISKKSAELSLTV